jgi:hypothetical protein
MSDTAASDEDQIPDSQLTIYDALDAQEDQQ